jgi:5'-3' exonuclease
MSEPKRICLIDLSGIFRMHWHATEHEEVGEAHKRTIRDVVHFGAGYDHVAVCVDMPPYKRREIDPQYKAHRDKAPTVMIEQLKSAIDCIRDEGYHVLGSEGYEADDIIATMCEWAEENGFETTVYSSDKDLLQLVTTQTSVISVATRQKFGQQDVVEKFGVHPELIPDMLALTGDKSDNVPGVKGCGTKTAAKWINEYGDLAGVLSNADKLGRFAKIVEVSKDLIGRSWKLAQLVTDVPINPESILKPISPRHRDAETETVIPEVLPPATASYVDEHRENEQAPKKSTALVATEYSQALEPQSSAQAWGLAQALFKSRMFGDFPNPEAILGVIMTGRSFGMDAVSSLRGFHSIKGRASPSSQLLIGLVKRHPACEWFRFVEGDDKSATWETKRRDEPEATSMTYTIDDARLAGLLSNDNWKKRPKTMLRWRAGVELARVVYSDIVSGLYTIEEEEEQNG